MQVFLDVTTYHAVDVDSGRPAGTKGNAHSDRYQNYRVRIRAYLS